MRGGLKVNNTPDKEFTPTAEKTKIGMLSRHVSA